MSMTDWVSGVGGLRESCLCCLTIHRGLGLAATGRFCCWRCAWLQERKQGHHDALMMHALMQGGWQVREAHRPRRSSTARRGGSSAAPCSDRGHGLLCAGRPRSPSPPPAARSRTGWARASAAWWRTAQTLSSAPCRCAPSHGRARPAKSLWRVSQGQAQHGARRLQCPHPTPPYRGLTDLWTRPAAMSWCFVSPSSPSAPSACRAGRRMGRSHEGFLPAPALWVRVPKLPDGSVACSALPRWRRRWPSGPWLVCTRARHQGQLWVSWRRWRGTQVPAARAGRAGALHARLVRAPGGRGARTRPPK